MLDTEPSAFHAFSFNDLDNLPPYILLLPHFTDEEAEIHGVS